MNPRDPATEAAVDLRIIQLQPPAVVVGFGHRDVEWRLGAGNVDVFESGTPGVVSDAGRWSEGLGGSANQEIAALDVGDFEDAEVVVAGDDIGASVSVGV